MKLAINWGKAIIGQENMFCKNCRSFYSTIGANSAKRLPKTLNSKWKYELDETVEERIQDEIIKPRHHPGISKSSSISMPRSFIEAVRNTLEDEDHPKANILQNSPKFIRYLKEKKPPIEQEELKEKVKAIKNEVLERLSQKRCDLLNDKYVIKNQMSGELKRRVYNWTPTKYDKLNALFYLVGKSAADYAVLLKIFSEIKARDLNWNPRSLFDYGSGVGTVTWAANSIWPNSIFEFFNVDVSSDMNELAEHLLKGGRGEKQISLKGVYYRQFLPATPRPYDIVVSAYTLMELPSLKSRLENITKLWSKTTKYLVIVEQGSNAGYKIINEVRDFILNLENSHVFSPCPHDQVCPRFLLDDGTPCNFEVKYYNMPLNGPSQLNSELYSYIVLKKGKRDSEEVPWPRLVRPTLLRHKHCVCNLCTVDGKIEQAVFTASKYGKTAYRCAKVSSWGDRLPMNVKESCRNNEEDKKSFS